MLPWASFDRDQKQDKYRQHVEDPLDCDFCMKTLTKQERARVGCGWMIEEQRISGFRGGPDGSPADSECPGYSMKLPEVMEAARALGWKKDGLIREIYEDGITPIAADAIDIVDAEIRSVERHAMRVIQGEGRRRG